jgi:DNA-binding XRE family transcriptional regulator
MTTEMNVCSGCQYPVYPGRPGRIIVRTVRGVLCDYCVRSASAQMELALRRSSAMVGVRQAVANLLDVVDPSRPRWHAESDLTDLRVLESQLDKLVLQFVLRSGPFAEKPEPSASGMPNRPDLQIIESSGDPAPSSAMSCVTEGTIYALVRDVLAAELLDWPTPRMNELLGRHELDGEQARLGVQEMLDELRGRGEFQDERPHLKLVPDPELAEQTSETDTKVGVQPPGPDQAENAAPEPVTRSADSRILVERLAAWMRDGGLSELALAKRTRRDRATIAHFFTRDDRRISLRFYLDLVRSAGASLRGAPETTPHAVVARLKDLSNQQGLTVSTLALRAGVHRSQLSTIFNKADPNPSLWTVKRLAAALRADTELDLVEPQPPRVVNSGAVVERG